MLDHDPKHEIFVTVLVLGKGNGARALAGQLWVAGTSLRSSMGTSLLFLDLTLQTLLVSREHEDLMGYMLYFGPRSKSKTPPRPYKHKREGTCAGGGMSLEVVVSLTC